MTVISEVTQSCQDAWALMHYGNCLDFIWAGSVNREKEGRLASGVKFFGMITPTIKRLEYIINIKKLITRNLTLGVADGDLYADGEKVYSAENLKVGLFE